MIMASINGWEESPRHVASILGHSLITNLFYRASLCLIGPHASPVTRPTVLYQPLVSSIAPDYMPQRNEPQGLSHKGRATKTTAADTIQWAIGRQQSQSAGLPAPGGPSSVPTGTTASTLTAPAALALMGTAHQNTPIPANGNPHPRRQIVGPVGPQRYI